MCVGAENTPKYSKKFLLFGAGLGLCSRRAKSRSNRIRTRNRRVNTAPWTFIAFSVFCMCMCVCESVEKYIFIFIPSTTFFSALFFIACAHFTQCLRRRIHAIIQLNALSVYRWCFCCLFYYLRTFFRRKLFMNDFFAFASIHKIQHSYWHALLLFEFIYFSLHALVICVT